jgi:hypothetical protein
VSVRMLYWHYNKGDPALRSINRFLLAYFVARIVYFFFIFGDISGDMATFCGLLGLSAALNRPESRVEEAPVLPVQRPLTIPAQA